MDKNGNSIIPIPYLSRFSLITEKKKVSRPREIVKMVNAIRKKQYPQCCISFRAEISEIVSSVDWKNLHADRGQAEVIIAVFLKIVKTRSKKPMCKEANKFMDVEIFKEFITNTFCVTDEVGLCGIVRAFKAYDSNNYMATLHGISSWCFLKGMDVLLSGTIDEISLFAFNACDIDRDSKLRDSYEFEILLKNCCYYIGLENPLLDTDETEKELINSVMQIFQSVTGKSDSIKLVTYPMFRDVIRQYPILLECLLPFIPNERFRKTITGLFSN